MTPDDITLTVDEIVYGVAVGFLGGVLLGLIVGGM